MKIKILYLLLLSLISIKSFSQYTAIPDSNFENSLSAYDDIPNDNQILTSNINDITYLSINHNEISNLTGISDFTSLVTLHCHNNLLTTLDLSNNINLETLGCSLNNLNTINISNCLSLTNLYCQNNSLDELIVSSNTNLNWLYCNNNELTTLDTSLNINIEDIDCSGNLIETIEISDNVRYLNCSNNQITELDLSALSNLESLGCNNNQITELDLSTLLNFEGLNCSNNSLINLNVRNGNNTSFEGGINSLNNPNLTCIFVDDIIYSSENWINIDPNSTFVETQAECDVLIINDELIKQNIKLFPNPTSSIIYIENYGNMILEKINISNILGEEIKECNTFDEINLSNLPKGIYFINIQNSKGHIAVFKIIKN